MARCMVQLLIACLLVSAAAASLFWSPAGGTAGKKPAATVEGDRERERRQRVRYTASWAVEITEGGDKMADLVARRHGYRNIGKVANFDNVYHFMLGDGERVRAPTDAPYTAKSSALLSDRSVGFADQQFVRPVYKRSYRIPRDPRFREQWHLLNTGQFGIEYRGRDLNIEKVWMQGLSGCNITVGIVDDGFEYVHPDLRDNYAPAVSYDFVDGDPDPVKDVDDWHGTRCAGLVSAAKDGEACGVGVAPNSKFGGLRLLGAFTDLNEASSLTYANDVIDIYSNSWGPCDEGCVDGPLRLTELALRTGSQRGRDGKGSIFVWANGNGGPEDDCAADGYSSSIYTISVGAVGVDGVQSWYDEDCSAKMVSAYVTDHNGYSAISTTSTDELCVYGFGGTSAACPMVAGAISLTLEANANLTWRDVMYLVVYTSDTSITAAGSYTTNGAGRKFSPKFGFGILDTEAVVARARHWINVPPQIEHIRIPSRPSGTASRTQTAQLSYFYSGNIRYLEHVVVNVTLVPKGRRDPLRGHMSIELRSPSRTRSSLLKFRSIDNSNRNYYKWPFMSLAFWGEDPRGTWQLTIRSQSSETDVQYSNLRFQFYGTSVTPPAVERIPSRCHADCARGCAAAGSQFCDACVNLRNAYTMECIDHCPPGYGPRNGYCYDHSLPEAVCNSKLLSLTSGSCVKAGFSGCCTSGKCEGILSSSPFGLCHCDHICHNLGDCCKDIDKINCTRRGVDVTPTHYVTLRSSEGVATEVVPITDDGASSVIRIPSPFPFGASLHTTVYVGTNGYFSFDKVFTDYTPYEFPGSSKVSLVSPFFSDIDTSYGTGIIRYEVHTLSQSPTVLAEVSRIINEHTGEAFAGSWLLLAEWRNVPEYGRSQRITNTFQGIVVTDFTESYAVFIYKCQDMRFSASGVIGFTTVDYSHFANHRLNGYNSRRVGCINTGESDWVNVVYKLTREDLQPVQPTELDDECELDLHNCEQECIDLPNGFVCSCYDDYALQRNGAHCFPYCHFDYTTEVGQFHTPSWPDNYPQSFHCRWRVNLTESLAGTNYFIVFKIDTSAYGMESNCSEEYIEFYDGLSGNVTSLGRFCGTTAPLPIAATGLEAKVVFVASDEHPDHLRGVRVTYSIALQENECEENNGGCEHSCKDLPFSFVCECNPGYQLVSNGKNCIDTDECEQSSHDCDQICTNTLGSYECSCETDFTLGDDSRTCVPSCTATYTALSGSFQSPGWPAYYPQLDFSCRWTIDLEEADYGIRFSVDSSVYGILGAPPCHTDYLQFYDGLTSDAVSLGRFCHLTIPREIVTTTGRALVVFKSSSMTRPLSRKGARITYEAYRLVDECLVDNGGCEQICQDTRLSFSCQCRNGYTLNEDGRSCDDLDECSLGEHNCEQLCVNIPGSHRCDCEEGFALNSDGRTCGISCGGEYTADSGSFHTPGWPTQYPLNFRCEWYISPTNSTPNTIISLTVDGSHFGVHGRDPCTTDYLQFHDGNTTRARSLGIFCFLRAPGTVYTNTSQAVVVFQASHISHLPSRVGARITYQVFRRVNECEVDNGGCEGTCVDTLTSFECKCSAGYTVASDGLRCEDVDECSLGTHNCQQICVNVKGSYQCDCEEGFALNSDGRTCGISCGGEYTADSGSFHTPGWPAQYPLNFRCEWYISPTNSTPNTILSLTVDDSNYGVHGRDPCTTDYLRLYDGGTTASRSLGVFCGLLVPSAHYTSTSHALVVFQSSNIQRRSNRAGIRVSYRMFELANECEVDNGGCEGTCANTLTSFECRCEEGYTLASDGHSCEDVDECTTSHSDYCDGLCVNTEGSFYCTCDPDFRLGSDGRTCLPVCGGTIIGDSGSIATPGWPDFYPSVSFTCEWVVETANNTIIDLSFDEQFGIIGSPPCTTDYIDIIDGPRGSASLGKYCGRTVPVSVCTSANITTVVFQGSRQSHSPQHVGANITYTTVTRVNECETSNGGCEHLCVDLPKSFACECRPGYTLASNGKNCTDIDECALRHNCLERCVNTEGSFHCACNDPGFVMGIDGRTCIPGCGGILTGVNGTFSTPGWPGFYYSLNYNCTWIIDVADQTNAAVDISFNDPFGIHGRDPCRTDYVDVFDGVGESAQSLGRFCFLRKPGVFSMPSTHATVVFQASTARHTPSRVGISVTYTTVHLGVDECLEDNGGCEQLCVNTRRSYDCLCNDGYLLGSDGRQCTDVNECSSADHGCEHTCVNTEGSYYCECDDGFVLSGNERSCSLDCGGTLPLNSGSFHSPGWPDEYPQLDFRCTWTMENIPTGHSVAFVVDKSAYGIHGSSPCVRDYLEFFDASGFSGRSVGRYCNVEPPEPVIVESEGARIVFQGRTNQNRAADRVGVRVSYTVLENECDVDNGGCEYTCKDTIFSYECGCPAGHQLAADGHTCNDIDECALGTHECSQLCNNTVGLYYCSCLDMFTLAPDGKTCIPVCGDTFSFPNGTFRTPGWPHFYPELDFVCEWIIDVSNDYLENGNRSAVKFVFNETAFGFGGHSNCNRDYMKFYSGTSSDAVAAVRVCASDVPMPFTVSSSEVRVVFRGSSLPHMEGQVGAMVSFFTIEQEYGAAPCGASEVVDFAGNCREVDCGGTVYSMSGVLQSPNWASAHSINALCQWSIVLPNPSASVNISIDSINIFRSNSGLCFWDYLIVFDTSEGNGRVPELLSGSRICGSVAPSNQMVATGNTVHVWYQSRDTRDRGFSLSFSAVV